MGFHGGAWMVRASETKPKVTWRLMRRVFSYARPYRLGIAGMLLLILATTGLNLLTPLVVRDLIDHTIPNGDITRLVGLAVLLLLIPAFLGAINVIQRRVSAQVGEGVIYDLRVALYSHLQRMSLRFFTNTRVGELMSRMNNDVVGAQNAITNTIVSIITNSIQTVAVLAVMLSMEWRLTLVSILILPLFVLAARKLGWQLRDIAREQLDANAQMNAMMVETLGIGGALLVKLFGRRKTEIKRFEERAGTVRDLGVKRAYISTVFFVIIGGVSAVGTALIYGLGGYFVIQKAFTIGTIVAFGAYLSSLYGALQNLTNAPVEFATSVVSFERVFEVIDLPEEIADRPDAGVLQTARGELTFEDVDFRYEANPGGLLSEVKRYGSMDSVKTALSGGTRSPKSEGPAPAQPVRTPAASPVETPGNGHNGHVEEEEEPAEGESHSQARDSALEGINLHVSPGQLVALVGPSGAGKTTLTYLIPRLYDPVAGRVLIDGHDLRDVTLESLTAQIGVVTQETHLFHDTIRTNLIYARLDATQAEIEAACQAANIHDFIVDLPLGYETVVGERGYRLSGGEKQRIALARVILKDPRILVLDEATSSLDSESERLIQDALKRVMAGRTSIVIAHRLSTILAADQILVFDRGRIVERGTHAELLTQNGLYSQLYETQFSRAG